MLAPAPTWPGCSLSTGTRRPPERGAGPASVSAADRLLGQRGDPGLRGRDHAGAVAVGLLVPDDGAHIDAVPQLLDPPDGILLVELGEALDRQFALAERAQLTASVVQRLGSAARTFAAGHRLGAPQRGVPAGGGDIAGRSGEPGGPVRGLGDRPTRPLADLLGAAHGAVHAFACGADRQRDGLG